MGDSNATVLVVAIITSGLNWRTRHNFSTSKWRFKNNSVRLIKKEIKRTRLMRHNLQSQERAYDVTTYKVKNEANTSQLTKSRTRLLRHTLQHYQYWSILSQLEPRIPRYKCFCLSISSPARQRRPGKTRAGDRSSRGLVPDPGQALPDSSPIFPRANNTRVLPHL